MHILHKQYFNKNIIFYILFRFIRKAKVNGFKEEMPLNMIDQFDKVIEQKLKTLDLNVSKDEQRFSR